MMFAKNEVNRGPQQIIVGSLQGNIVLGDTINVNAAQYNAGSSAAPTAVPTEYDRKGGGLDENASASMKVKMLSRAENEHIKACQKSSRVIHIEDIQGSGDK